MKFTRVVVACNVCWMQSSSQVEREATHTVLYRLGDEAGAQEFRLDLCDEHSNGVIKMLEYGEKIDSPPTVAGKRKIGRPRKAAAEPMTRPELELQSPEHQRLVCVTCGRPCRSQSGLSIHTKTQHPEEWERVIAQRAAEAGA